MGKTERAAVYAAIDTERNYQDSQWGPNPHSPTEFLVYMRDYVEEALHFLTRGPDDEVGPKALHWVRKVAALGVACMEHNGAPFREGFDPGPTAQTPPHACSAPGWCGLRNEPPKNARTAVERARHNAYLAESNRNDGVLRLGRLYCSDGCALEAGALGPPRASMRGPG